MYINFHMFAFRRFVAFALVGVMLASLFVPSIEASGSAEIAPTSSEVSGNGSSGTSQTIFGQNAPRDTEYAAGGLIVKFKPEVGGNVTDVKVDFRTYITHTPILIRNNSEFVAEHGVIGGSGTASDPYIIENYSIDASSANGISIQNTTAYFIVRNCLVENGGQDCYGIYLDNVINGKIENNTCSTTSDCGVYIDSSDNNALINNNCSNNREGIYIDSSDNNALINNNCSNNSCGIFLCNSNYNILINNNCSNNGEGINLYESSACTIENNTCKNNTYYGICLSSSYYDNLTGNTCENNTYYGICLSSSYYDNLTGNTCENNYSSGIYLVSSSYDNLTNNVCTNAYYGICLDSSSSHDNLTANTCSNNGYGIYLFSSSNTLTGNVISNNRYDIYNSGTTNTYSSNQFNNNITSKMLTFTDITRTKNVGDTISFSVSTFSLNGSGLSGCVVTTSPSESSLSYDNGSSTATGWFIPTKSGIYSLNFTVTDANSNTTKRRVVFFVGTTVSTTTKYYFRGVSPIHGQPYGTGLDSRTLLLTAPTGTEIGLCGVWVQISPDEIPNYPLANLSAIDTCTWYKQSDVFGGYIGVERYVTYSTTVDNRQSVGAVGNYTWINENFAENWGMDYPQNWYRLSLKLYGINPYWTTFPSGHSASEASYANFTYSYTTTPAIKSISNPDNILLLSATAPVDDNENATIILDGTGSTNIVLDNYHRPFIGYTTTIGSDNTATIAANGLTGTTTINSVAMDIAPSSGSIDVNIDTWNTSGTYYKKWTENGSSPDITASHTIGNLKANTYYTVEVNGAVFGTYQSNSSGQITFTYNGGYSTRTFEIETIEDVWVQTRWSGVATCPNVQVGVWDTTYDNWYLHENVTHNAENIVGPMIGHGFLESSVYDARDLANWARVEFDTSGRFGGIRVYLRFDNDDNVTDKEWVEVENCENFDVDARYVQYKVELIGPIQIVLAENIYPVQTRPAMEAPTSVGNGVAPKIGRILIRPKVFKEIRIYYTS